jgi:uncharacterized membrane protein
MAKKETAKASDGWLARRLRGVRRRPHFHTAAAIFVVLAATLAGAGFDLLRGMLIAFDVASLLFLAMIARKFLKDDVNQLRKNASEEDGGRWGVLGSSVLISIVALAGLTIELKGDDAGSTMAGIALAGGSILMSWFFLNTMFALHYAHAYYARSGKQTALEFPNTTQPDYWDFLYFSFVIGMTFQVSDVNIADRGIRRLVLAHGVIAFFFNLGILALSINIVAGKA